MATDELEWRNTKMIQPSDFFKRDEMREAQKARLIQAVENSELDYDEVITMVDNASQFMNGYIVPDRGKLPYEPWEEEFVECFRDMQNHVHQVALSKQWYGPRGEDERNDGELIALFHEELSEALKALRKGNPPDEHLPHFDSYTVELADCMIRIMDTAARKGLRLSEAIVEKSRYNMTRPPRHGKCF